MDIERLKEGVRDLEYELEYGEEQHLGRIAVDVECLRSVIDFANEAITLQSVTSEEVQRAIEWAEQERKNSFRYMDFGDADSAALAITALRQMKPTDEAVQDAISWLESDKIDRQREWEKQDTEWKLEPGAKEMHDSFMSAFDLAIQALRQMKPSEWIPVSERLPESGKEVLMNVAYNNRNQSKYDKVTKGFYVERFSIKEETWSDFTGNEDYCEEDDTYYIRQGWYSVCNFVDDFSYIDVPSGFTVTHWMPLPNPPESEVRATPVSGDSPIAVRCQACGCPVVLHRLFEYGVLAGEHIDCACGYVYGWGMED